MHIYIGNTQSTADSSNQVIKIDASYFTDYPFLLYNVFAHELFHLIQNEYFLTADTILRESTAVLAEQVVSKEYYKYSIDKDYRNRAISLHNPYFHVGGYPKNLFYRYVFEQLHGTSPNLFQGTWQQSTAITTKYLKKYFEYIYDQHTNDRYQNASGDIHLNKTLQDFIASKKTNQSFISNLREAEDNYITAQYAYRYVNPQDHPRYTFLTSRSLKCSSYNLKRPENVEPLLYTSEINPIRLFSTLTLSNKETEYLYQYGFGFLYYLTAEYHKLQLGQVINKIKFTKKRGDEYLRFQLIIRYNDGKIDVKRLFDQNNTSINKSKTPVEVHTFENKENIAEIIFAAYTTHKNPLAYSEGRIYDVNIQGERY